MSTCTEYLASRYQVFEVNAQRTSIASKWKNPDVMDKVQIQKMCRLLQNVTFTRSVLRRKIILLFYAASPLLYYPHVQLRKSQPKVYTLHLMPPRYYYVSSTEYMVKRTVFLNLVPPVMEALGSPTTYLHEIKSLI